VGVKIKETYAALFMVFLATIYFVMRAFDGLKIAVERPAELGGIFISVLIFLVIGIIIVKIFAATLAATLEGEDSVEYPRGDDVDDGLVEVDERDVLIEARGERLGYSALGFMVALLVISFILNDMDPARGFSFLNLGTPVAWGVWLILALLVSNLIKLASMAISYGR